MKSKPVKGFFVKMNKNETQFIESDKGDYTRYEYDDGTTVFLKKPELHKKSDKLDFTVSKKSHYNGTNPKEPFLMDEIAFFDFGNRPRYVGGIDPYTHPDTERLDKLQRLTTGYGKGWILRDSFNGRGMRLHETSHDGAYPTVREAIDNFKEPE